MEGRNYEDSPQNLKAECHDCGEEIQCLPGFDGMPTSPKGKHKLFYHMNIGWFLCCNTTVQGFGKKSEKNTQEPDEPSKKKKKGQSLLYHPCRW